MNIQQIVSLFTQVMPLLSSGTQGKIQAALPKIIAAAIEGAVANIGGGQQGMEAGATAGAIQALITALQ